jgi:hypothetical protein
LSVAFALVCLHSQGLYHGSVDPTHVLFDNDLFGGDFLHLDLTSSLYFRDRISPPSHYSAPELARGEASSASDVYSFGVLLYEILTRSPIIPSGCSISEFHERIVGGFVPDFPDVVDPVLVRLIGQCLSADCAVRPSIQAVLDELIRTGPDPFHPRCFSRVDLESIWLFVGQTDVGTLQRTAQAAYAGDAIAQNQTGFFAEHGYHCRQHLRQALAFYVSSGHQENPSAIFNIGICLTKGIGIEADAVEAATYYEKAANLGHPESMWVYGDCLENGLGVCKNLEMAVRYYQKSAEGGNPTGIYRYAQTLENDHETAMVRYGLCLEQGRGVEKDAKLAIRKTRRGHFVWDAVMSTALELIKI